MTHPFLIDHVVIAVQDLDRAVQDYRAIGFTVTPGGTHASGTTHNALIVFPDGTYLELLAPTGQPPAPGSIDYSPMLNGGEGLAGFALRCEGIESVRERLIAASVAVGEVVEGGRVTADGTRLAWKLLRIEPDGPLHGFAPFLIEDITPRAWRVPEDGESTTHANGAAGSGQIVIRVPVLAESRNRFEALNGVRGFRFTYMDKPALKLTRIPVSLIERARDRSEWMWSAEISSDMRLVVHHSADVQAPMSLERGWFFPAPWADRFNDLDEVDWANLSHARGPADDLPLILLGLVTDYTAMRSRALDELRGMLAHDGLPAYSASPVIIPFIHRLISEPAYPDRAQLMRFLNDLVYWDRPETAADPYEVFATHVEYRRIYRAMRAAYLSGVAAYLSLLNDADAALRTQAANALWKCWETPGVEDALRARLAIEPDPDVRAALLRSLIQVWTHEDTRPLNDDHLDELERMHARADEPPRLRFQAAQALARAGRIDAAMLTFQQIFFNKATRDGLGYFVHFQVIDALGVAGAWQSAFALAQSATHSEADVSNLKHAISALSYLNTRWRPAEALTPLIFAQLTTHPDESVREAAAQALEAERAEVPDPDTFKGIMQEMLTEARLDDLVSLVPEVRLQPALLSEPTENLITELMSLADDPFIEERSMRIADILHTLIERGESAHSALPTIRRLIGQWDGLGTIVPVAACLWWTLAPEEGDAITAAILRQLRPTQHSLQLFVLLGEIGVQAKAAIPTLTTIIHAELRGDGYVDGPESVSVSLDRDLRAAAMRALARIQEDSP